MILEITTTATLRPELLEITLRSFYNRLFFKFERTRLFINIDPIGGSQNCYESMLHISKQYCDEVIENTPETASFSKSAQWAWSQVSEPFFLHLEDDWLLKKNIDPNIILNGFSKEKKLASIRLNREQNSDSINHHEISLNPNFIRTSYIKKALAKYNNRLDPEKQFYIDPLLSDLSNWTHILYGEPGESAYVKDIGRRWRKAHGLGKWAHYGESTIWENGSITTGNRISNFLKFNIGYPMLSLQAGPKRINKSVNP